MEFIIINHQELAALSGLPYLQQLIYLRGLKPYIDYNTGIIGIRRGISYQSLSEALYIEPHPGIKSGSPNKDQLRRALKGLEKAGLIEIQSWERKLVFRCLFWDMPYSVQNKLATKAHDHPTTNQPEENPEKSINYFLNEPRPTTPQKPKATTPQNNNNYFYFFLLQAFEKFWDLYPLKNEKENAFEVFKKIKPSQVLVDEILAALAWQIKFYQQQLSESIWMPAWKYPANWLAQRCWEQKQTMTETKEYEHAIHETNHASQPDDNLTRISQSSENTNFSDTEFQKLWKMH